MDHLDYRRTPEDCRRRLAARVEHYGGRAEAFPRAHSGRPDFLVLFPGRLNFVYIRPMGRDLTDAQAKWFARSEREGLRVSMIRASYDQVDKWVLREYLASGGAL